MKYSGAIAFLAATCGSVSASDGFRRSGDPPLTYVAKNLLDQNQQWFPFNDVRYNMAPVVFAQLQSMTDSDTVDVRLTDKNMNGFKAFAQEETTKDDEVQRTQKEDLGIAVFDKGPIFDRNGNAIGESGNIPCTHEEDGRAMMHDYVDPVVIIMTDTFYHENPVHVRVREVNPAFFTYALEEWGRGQQSFDGRESCNYLVLESGTHILLDGRIIAANKDWIDHNDKTTGWRGLFPDVDHPPVILAQTQTYEGKDPVIARVHNVVVNDELDFVAADFFLQEAEVYTDGHKPELVARVAIGQSNEGLYP